MFQQKIVPKNANLTERKWKEKNVRFFHGLGQCSTTLRTFESLVYENKNMRTFMVFKDNFMNSPNKPHWLLPFIQYCQIQEYQVLKKKN